MTSPHQHDALPMAVTMFSSRTDTSATPHPTTWGEIATALQKPQPRGALGIDAYLASDRDTRQRQKDGIAWMPCVVKAGGSRRQEDASDYCALVLDFDDGTSLSQITSTLAPYEFVAHTTYSHHPAQPKHRVVLPLSHTVIPASIPKLFDVVNGWLGGIADRSCGHDISRAYYWPSCPPDAVSTFAAHHNRGILLDPDSVLTKAKTTPAAHVGGPDFETGFGDGERTRELTCRAGWCLSKGKDLGETIKACLDWNKHNNPPLDQEKVISTCQGIAKTHGRAEDAALAETETLIDSLNQQYAFIEKQNMIYRFRFYDFITPGQLGIRFANTLCRARVGNSDKTKLLTLSDAWLCSSRRRQHRDVVFSPGDPVVADDCVNLWRGWGCDPVPGDISPWQALLYFVFRGQAAHRAWFEQWAAYPIQHPGTKLNTAVVLWSGAQGMGKTLLGETIGKLYGEHFQTISATELHGAFNGWARSCQFVLGEENTSADARADSNKLKHLITGDVITINEKFQPAITLKNRLNFLFTSNHPDAFFLELHDRRFFVWELQGNRMTDDFYADFVEWRDRRGGLQALMHHMRTVDLSSFNPKMAAPVTDAKLAMIDVGRSDLERYLAELRDDDTYATQTFGKHILTIEEVVRWYNDKSGARANTTSVGKALKRVGLGEKRRVVTAKGRLNLTPVCDPDLWRGRDNDEWRLEYEKPVAMPARLALVA